MTTITKERLLTIKQWRETYGPGSNVVLPAEEAEELARIALASLEAEPVAWTDEEELRDVRKYGFGEIFQCPPDKYADPRRVISLYRELPAPVVPDDWQLVPKKITLEMECALSKADSYEIGWLWALAAAPKYEVQNAKRVQNALNACRAAMLQSGNFRESKNSSTNNFREIPEASTSSPVTPALLPGGFTIEEAKELHEDLVRSHISKALSGEKMKKKDRDADLRWIHGVIVQAAWFVKASLEQNALSGNSPATPDGWISCSEQMPEMGERQCYVLAADFKNNYPPNIPNTQVGVYGDWFNDGNPTWDDGDGEDLYLKEVTHWMQLPEPPQEAK
ncbi:DUF551 domain-containing protein [Escherichia coli]|nr:DUF551 domain-containing protein [Escherichia coli]